MAIQEEDILLRIRGEHYEEAFDLIVDRYTEPLYYLLRRFFNFHEDADDCLQEVFISVWNNLGRFKYQSSLYTWLYRIATNKALSALRKRKKALHISLDNDVADQRLQEQLLADPFFSGDDAQAKLACAIDALPAKQKAVFNLRYFEEMPYEQISEILDTSIGALKASYHHAVRKVEDFLTLEKV